MHVRSVVDDWLLEYYVQLFGGAVVQVVVNFHFGLHLTFSISIEGYIDLGGL